MKKILILSYCNLYILPYAKTYIGSSIQSGNECTIVYWDRDCDGGDKDAYPGTIQIAYYRKITGKSSWKEKILGYIGATRLFRRVLKTQAYDFVVVLEATAGVACFDLLTKKYRQKYLLDIRDYSLENNKIFYYVESLVVRYSKMNVISSPAYRRFLPNSGSYVVSHNYFPSNCEEKCSDSFRDVETNNNVINISFVGTVRFYDVNKKILDAFKNDNRFSINYFGKGSEVLKEYCHNNGINNARFHGAFNSEMTMNMYRNTQLINNLYGNHSKYLDYALSNRLYHACELRIPILVCKDTYMAEVVEKYNLGYAVDINKPVVPEEIYNWYIKFNIEQFALGCEKLLHDVELDNKEYIERWTAILNSEI